MSDQKVLTLEVKTKRHMPGFAGYLAGSVLTGRVQILLNIDALLWASVEGASGEFKRSTIDCLAHEFIHALEEQFGLLFDEEAVEASIARVRAAQQPDAVVTPPRKSKPQMPPRLKKPCPLCRRPSAITARTGGPCFYCKYTRRKTR